MSLQFCAALGCSGFRLSNLPRRRIPPRGWCWGQSPAPLRKVTPTTDTSTGTASLARVTPTADIAMDAHHHYRYNARMRTTPITRDEIRITQYYGNISTVPGDAVRVGKHGLEIIPGLFDDLVREMNQEQDEVSARKRKIWGSRFKSPKPKTEPRLSYAKLRVCCIQCDSRFYNARNCRGKYCSDRCVHAARSVAGSKLRTKSRAAKREGLKCKKCNKLFSAKRSTALFFSIRCRVAAHRGA
jgi:hypothetical protein